MKEGLKVTLNNKNYQNILFQSRDTIVTMSKFVTKNRINANFIVLYPRTKSRYRRIFFSFEFVSRSSFSNRHQISNTINLEISLWGYDIIFPPKIQKTKKSKMIETFTIKNIFYCSKFKVDQINTRKVILPQKSWPNMDK